MDFELRTLDVIDGYRSAEHNGPDSAELAKFLTELALAYEINSKTLSLLSAICQDIMSGKCCLIEVISLD